MDIMGNGGGDGCYMNLLIQYLVPTGFQPIRLQVRATEEWVISYEIALFDAEVFRAGQDTIDTLASDLGQILQALAQKRGNTPPINALSPAACFLTGGALYPPATDASGNNIAYTKPIVVLTNNFSISAAELFGATLEDANRVTVYGVRTDGGGGNVVEFNAAPTPRDCPASLSRWVSAITTSRLRAFPPPPSSKTSASFPMFMLTSKLAPTFSLAASPSSRDSQTSS